MTQEAGTLLDLLSSLRRRVKLWGTVLGMGVVVTAGVAALLGAVLLDYLLDLPSVPRLVLVALVAATTGYSLLRFVLRPLLSRLSLSDVAGHLEQAFPQFGDRLRSTVDFVRGGNPGSAAMQQRVVGEANELADKLDLSQALALRPVWYSLAAGAGAVIVLMAAALLAGGQFRQVAVARLLDPFGTARWPRSVEIALVGDVPRRVPVGQKVDVKMRLARGDGSSRRAIIYYQYDGGPVQQEYMARADDGTYAASLDARGDASQGTGSLRVWMKAGDDEKSLPIISIVPRLAVNRVEAVIVPPPYANLPPTTVNLSNAPAVLVAGADVLVRVTFSKPLDVTKTVQIIPATPEGKVPEGLRWGRSSTSIFTARWTALVPLRFHIRATDTDGFQNTGLEEYELIVRPDQLPTVQIENPRRNEDRTANAVVPLQALAEDDYGINSLKLVVDRLAVPGSAPATTQPATQAAGNHWEIDLAENGAPRSPAVWSKVDGAAERQRYRLNYAWELSQLAGANLKAGDVLEYYVQVQDNFDLDGKTHPPVPSGHLRIAIISQEQLSSRASDELRAIAHEVGEVRNAQNRVKAETGDLATDTAKKPQFDDADRAAADRLANQQSSIASQTRQVGQKLSALLGRMEENRSPNQELKSIASDVRTQLDQTSENPMKDAGRKISQASQPRQTADERNGALKDAVGAQQLASDQLQRAMDRMGNLGSLQQTIDRIRDLLAKQQGISKDTADIGKRNLGKKPEQMSPEDRARLDKTSKEQEELADTTEQALADMQKVAEQLSKSDPAAADAMKQAAATAQQQQVSASQARAAQQARQNQQSGAQAAQKQAELGLEMMLSNLRSAERRKLEELSQQLEQIQKQLANLIRRQAGHNLDNLTLQGPQAPQKLEPKALADLTAKAERVGGDPPAVELPQLSASQEQTERNTRDISRTLEGVTEGAETAANVTRAAGRMERAAVLLRGSKLADAYDPPQTQALAALEEAKRRVDAQKAKVDQNRDEQRKETIRQAYMEIREAQEKLNKDTARIDSAPRLSEGGLARQDAIRLGQLPGEQGSLADRTQAMEEQLSSISSLVYVWANRDIVSSMNGVKGDLAKPATGKPTQAEQTRIVEQLDAMIRALATKPPEPEKFANRPAGGGSGGGGASAPTPPRLPPEVELRLLKELQLAVNRSTRTIDGEPEERKDRPKLEALGGRQGELRDLLGDLLESTSKGKIKLGAEPDNKDQLPEEASGEQIENQELDQELLKEEPTKEKIDKDVNRIGDRMARSKQRLALNADPGKTTQAIQERIAQNMDDLIQMARQQQAQMQPSPSSGQAENVPKPGQPQQPKPDDQAAAAPAQQVQGAQRPAQQSVLRPGAQPNADLSQDIQQTMKEWGGNSPRQRAAVIEGAGETVVEKYKKLVDDYYRSLATKSAGRQ